MALKNIKNTPPDTKPVSKTRKQKKESTQPTQHNELIVVGIGASAGGLKALQAFFHALPGDTGMAFVVDSVSAG